ncbi:MAG: SMP-30/gluconolactonase/LRE family protein [Verrucomicrobiales bacterium]
MNRSPLTETRAILGEGPVWHDGRLVWIDIEGRKVFVHDPAGLTDQTIGLTERIGCVWPCAGSGRLVCGLQSGLAYLDPASGQLEVIADPEPDQPRTRFNDGKCDPLGRLWAGTMDMEETEALGSLYMLTGDGQVVRQGASITVANGLAWDPDGETFYHIDSPTRVVAAYDYEAATGKLSNRREIIPIPDVEGFPDGMTIDSEGKLWIALWGGWGVVRYDPKTGERLGKIDLPAEKVTSCTFGGDDLDELYITTALIGLGTSALEDQPSAGGLFKVKVGVPGLPATPFTGG